ncbi:MAG: response regulator transcription factor, partial [Desulfobacterales bacterium]
MPIKIFLADDHAVVREGLRLILEAEGDISVIGEAANGQLAVQQIQKLVPDVVVMDISMPILNGIKATDQIMSAKIPTRIIILSMHSSKEHILHALEVGAQGYLLKESAGKELIKAVRMVYAGHRFLSDSISRTINDGEIHQRKADSKENSIKTKKTYHNMQRLKLKSEKRRHVRFNAPENLFAALGNPVQKVGKVKDISMGGLAFEYIPGEKEDVSA